MLRKRTPPRPAKAVKSTKPDKPYPDFPLTAHPNGRWCKKIRGKVHYFGPWADWEGSLRAYVAQRDDLHAGRRPRPAGGVTVADLLNEFLYSKKLLVDTGELSRRSYDDYERTCDRIVASLGKSRYVDELGPHDFQKLRADLAKDRGPTTLKGEVGRARMVFLFASESGLIEKSLLYRRFLKAPSQRTLRKVANELGPRMFEAAEIQAMIDEASTAVKAMILLGINCGFGNSDCGTLPFQALDLKRGWHNYWRPKTHNPRRCPLWPETVAAIEDAIAQRPAHKQPEDANLVFITKYGQRWSHAEEGRAQPLSFEIRKLLVTLKLYRKNVTTFYSLRRTFETIGSTAGSQTAVDHIMGHVPASDDMAAVYRQKTFDSELLKVTNHVRAWLLGEISIS